MKRRLIGSNRNLKVLLLALVALASAAIGVTLYSTSLLAGLEGSTINGRFSVRGTQTPPKNLAIVAIDDKTFKDLNAFPFPRSYYARIINNLAAEHPAAIVFDIDLENKSTLGKTCHVSGNSYPCDDLTLLEAIGNHPGITVFGSTQPNENGNGEVLFLGSTSGTSLLHQLGSQPAAPLFPSNQPGNVYRQMTYSVQNVKTLYVAAAEHGLHRKITKSQFGPDQWIDYPGPNHTIPWISFSSVYNPKKYGAPEGSTRPLPPNYFRGKIVFIGETQLSLEDFHSTSTDGQMAGVEIEADATATILNNFPLKSAPGWINVALIVLFAVAVPLAAVRFRPIASLGLAVGLGIAFTIGTPARIQFGPYLVVHLPARDARAEHRGLRGRPARDRGVRAHQDA